MIPIPLTWADFSDGKSRKVVVEILYKESLESPTLTALVPADAYRSKDGYLVIEFVRFVRYAPVIRRSVHSDGNYPVMYLQSKLRYEVQLNLAVGNLVLWGKATDRLVKSNGMPWWDLWKDQPWYGYSRKDNDYTERVSI